MLWGQDRQHVGCHWRCWVPCLAVRARPSLPCKQISNLQQHTRGQLTRMLLGVLPKRQLRVLIVESWGVLKIRLLRVLRGRTVFFSLMFCPSPFSFASLSPPPNASFPASSQLSFPGSRLLLALSALPLMLGPSAATSALCLRPRACSLPSVAVASWSSEASFGSFARGLFPRLLGGVSPKALCVIKRPVLPSLALDQPTGPAPGHRS